MLAVSVLFVFAVNVLYYNGKVYYRIYRQDTKLVQLVKLSFAVINKLFTEKGEVCHHTILNVYFIKECLFLVNNLYNT